jgi:anti-anti-sigma factor
MLEIKIEQFLSGGRVRFTLIGRLDTQTYSQCEQRLKAFLTPTTRELIFDMSKLDYLSSMGLRVLMIASKTMAGMGGKCLLTNLQPPIRTVIDIAKALPSENIFSSVAEADAYLDVMQRRAREQGPGSTPSNSSARL